LLRKYIENNDDWINRRRVHLVGTRSRPLSYLQFLLPQLQFFFFFWRLRLAVELPVPHCASNSQFLHNGRTALATYRGRFRTE
jgi:hypothetical protein